jgi:hypothetical protein
MECDTGVNAEFSLLQSIYGTIFAVELWSGVFNDGVHHVRDWEDYHNEFFSPRLSNSTV